MAACSRRLITHQVRTRLFMIKDRKKPFEVILKYKPKVQKFHRLINQPKLEIKVIRMKSRKDIEQLIQKLCDRDCLKCKNRCKCTEP